MAARQAARLAMPHHDFPLWREITPVGWLIVLLFCAAGAVVLMIPGPPAFATIATRSMRVLLFVALPLLGLWLVAGKAWITLLARPRARDLWIGLAVVPLVFVTSVSVALLVRTLTATSANPINDLMAAMEPVQLAIFLVSVLPQLFGEELVTVIPFLAVFSICHVHLAISRRTALVSAWGISALIFGAIHLPTYDWHIMQALCVIGAARLALTIAYLVTKNIWSSTVAHIANDWMLFAIPLLLERNPV